MIQNALETVEEDAYREQFKELPDEGIYNYDETRSTVLQQSPRPGLTETTELTLENPTCGEITNEWYLAWSETETAGRDDTAHIPTAVADIQAVQLVASRLQLPLGSDTVQFGHGHDGPVYVDAVQRISASRLNSMINQYGDSIGATPDEVSGVGIKISGALDDQSPGDIFPECSREPGSGEQYTVVKETPSGMTEETVASNDELEQTLDSTVTAISRAEQEA